MKQFIIIFVILLLNISLYGIDIDSSSSNVSILDKSSIFLDNNSSLTIDTVKRKKFTKNNKIKLDFGLRPNSSLWIKFTLHNTGSKPINSVLEYQSTEIEEIFFYDLDKEIKRGLYHIPKKNKTIHPHFIVKLNPYETKIFYIRAYSKMRALSAKLILFDREDFIRSDYTLKMALLLFFGIMITLFIYNFMLWRFTKDRVYLFYILYLLGILSFEANYYGIYALYIFPPNIILFIEKGIITILAIMTIFFVVFAQEFLQLKKFRRINLILKIYLFIIPITAVLAYDNQFLDTNILLLYISLSPILIYSGFYALKQGIKEAKYYLIGWTLVILSIIVVVFQFIAIFDIKTIFPYILEFAFVSESFLFSIALAHKIEIAKDEKLSSDMKLISFQNEEKVRLEELVSNKTKELTISIEEKELLYKELNHRIKNNFMMILSLLKLQIRRTKNSETIASLDVTKNRIESIANLYEMLLLNNNSINIDTHLYIKGICNNITMHFTKDVKIDYNIKHNLDTDTLVYIGLIVNELITNSLKYAFNDNKGEINIQIRKEDRKIFLSITDNGKGFKDRRKNSLGLTIVEILVEGQLQGELNINSTNGTIVDIMWEED